jgi:hypothetical protein
MEQAMRGIESNDESTDTIKSGKGLRAAGRSGASGFQGAGFPLPPARPARWVPHRKAEVIAAVQGGYLSIDQACRRYELSVEEYLLWQRGVTLLGLAGLRVNSAKDIRRLRSGSEDSMTGAAQELREDRDE